MGVNGGRSLQEVFVENFENLINQSKQKTKKKSVWRRFKMPKQ